MLLRKPSSAFPLSLCILIVRFDPEVPGHRLGGGGAHHPSPLPGRGVSSRPPVPDPMGSLCSLVSRGLCPLHVPAGRGQSRPPTARGPLPGLCGPVGRVHWRDQ